MKQLNAISPSDAIGRNKELLAGVQSALGITPNMMRTMANSTAVLEGYLALTTALSQGSLTGKTREIISVAVAEANGCAYCLSAHTVLGSKSGLSQSAINLARSFQSDDPRTQVLLEFTAEIVQKKGKVGNDIFNKARAAGFTDAELAEIIANTALNIFTNYFNNAVGTEIDFTPVEPLTSQVAA